MKKLTQDQINKIVVDHKHWLKEDCEGWENMRANFSECDLNDVDLSNVSLRGAILRDAELRSANLRYADLRFADMKGADLRGADMYYANLRNANLRNTILHSAHLCYACLSFADLSYVNLGYAELSGADFRYADLGGADLYHANLSGADLSDADFSYARLCAADLDSVKEGFYVPMACPEEGAFIGWKKARRKIVKLLIPADALRSSATSRKCRCNKAKVIEIYNLDGTVSEEKEVASDRDHTFIYKVGKVVKVKNFDTDRWNECTRGIHFFINRQEAINYN